MIKEKYGENDNQDKNDKGGGDKKDKNEDENQDE